MKEGQAELTEAVLTWDRWMTADVLAFMAFSIGSVITPQRQQLVVVLFCDMLCWIYFFLFGRLSLFELSHKRKKIFIYGLVY